MKFLFVTLIALAGFTASAQQKNINDPGATQRSLSGSFTAIVVSDGIDLYLTQSDEVSLAVSASEEKYLERFKTEVVDGTLKIYYDNKGVHWAANEKRKLKAYVSFKTLEKLHASGGAGVTMQGTLNAASLSLKFTSGASFDGAVTAKELNIEQNSGSAVSVSGTAGTFKADVSSGAVLKGFDLTTDYCDAKATSGGGIRITINKELNAKANSGGGIKYKGAAVIKELDVNSGGMVKKA